MNEIFCDSLNENEWNFLRFFKWKWMKFFAILLMKMNEIFCDSFNENEWNTFNLTHTFNITWVNSLIIIDLPVPSSLCFWFPHIFADDTALLYIHSLLSAIQEILCLQYVKNTFFTRSAWLFVRPYVRTEKSIQNQTVI